MKQFSSNLDDMISSIRRHHYDRLKRRRREYWYGDGDQLSPKHLGMITKTPHDCSNHCCGNPRKHFRETTRQESEAALRFHEQLEEMTA